MKRAAIIILILAVVGLIFLFTKFVQAAGASTQKVQYKLAKVETGMVKKTVSATGTLTPWTTVDIKSKAGGKVLKMPVDVGTVVKKGQLLALIDPADTKLTVDTASADIRAAVAHTDQSKEIEKLQLRQTDIAIDTARASLASAEASLAAARTREATAKVTADTQQSLTDASIETARANLDQAKQTREAMNSTNPQQVATAKANFDQAVANAKNGESNLKRQKSLLDQGFVSQQVVDSAQAAYEVAVAQVDDSREKWNTVKAENDANTRAADERVKQAKAQLDNAVANKIDVPNKRRAYEEAVATTNQLRAQVKAAKAALDQAIENKRNNVIKRFDIDSNAAQIARAQATMTNARITYDQTTVRADSDGVVLQKYVEEGTIISSALSFAATGNNILQIGDVTRMYVDVTVDETDIANVDPGQAVDMSFDAYPGTPFEGKVIRIDPQASVVQNVTTIHVRVEVDNTSTTFKLLKPGMNSTCEFVIDKKDDVLSVPSEAIRTDDNGKFVETASGGTVAPLDPKTAAPDAKPDPNVKVDCKITRVAVETGLEGNESVEIKSGLKEGDTIVTQKIEPVVQQSSSPFGSGGMGRGFGGGQRK